MTIRIIKHEAVAKTSESKAKGNEGAHRSTVDTLG
jgi:hypothetical protein